MVEAQPQLAVVEEIWGKLENGCSDQWVLRFGEIVDLEMLVALCWAYWVAPEVVRAYWVAPEVVQWAYWVVPVVVQWAYWVAPEVAYWAQKDLAGRNLVV